MPKVGDILTSSEVAISTGHTGYPWTAPYSPGVAYPEHPFDSNTLTKEVNHAYEGVRDALRLLRLDAEHYGQGDWNPLGEIIRPGETVVLKPNFIRDYRETQAGHQDCLITHGSIIRATLDYVYIALKGNGRIIIADASQNDANFDAIRRIAGLDEIQEFYRCHAGFDVEVYDLRPERAQKTDGVIVGHERLRGDPAGYVKVNLGRYSAFDEISHLCHLLYGSEYDTNELRSHHHDDVHEYLISKTVLDADVVVNLAKLKTHKKTGVTLCMKNVVGINGNKNWLPHHRLGTPSQGGDQFADDSIGHRFEQKVMSCFRSLFPAMGAARRIVAKPLKAVGVRVFGDTNTDTIRSGNWYGNDTAWRMVIDLNRILMYADRNGHLQNSVARHTFCIVDGIVGGEGNGPLDPVPKSVNVVIAGRSAVSVDLACTHVMGFDVHKLPLLHRSFDAHRLPLVPSGSRDIALLSNDDSLTAEGLEQIDYSLGFSPHFGWKGHIERERQHTLSSIR
jgi:uncharacterized protein (DUF362 family)